jgi:hypothetical protein
MCRTPAGSTSVQTLKLAARMQHWTGRLLGELQESDQAPGIATELRAGRSGDLILVGARFFAHGQTGPEAHPASCTKGTGSLPGVKRPGCGADHPSSPSAEVENE